MTAVKMIKIVQEYLKNIQILVPDEWCSACIEWLNTQDPSIIYVLHQWLVADLREINEAILPCNLRDIKFRIIPKSYALQISSVRDIGSSAYQQIYKSKEIITNEEKLEIAENQKIISSRTLYLELTDGIQTIFAVETKYIPFLNVEIKPGAKVLIKGPINCRRGILLINPDNVHLLGGEVDTLLICNSYQNILRRILSLPEINEENLIFEEEEENLVLDASLEQQLDALEQSNMNIDSDNNISHLCKVNNESVVYSDDIRVANDGFTISNTFLNPMPVPSSATSQSISMQVDSITCNNLNNNSKVNFETCEEKIEFACLDWNVPFQYISDFPNPYVYHNPCIIRVKAFLITLLSKLNTKNDKWTLQVKLNDCTGSCNVDLDDKIITDIIGFTAVEFEISKQKAKNDLELRQRLTKKILNGQQRLISLHCLMDVEFKYQKRPQILSLIELEQHHIEELKNRLSLRKSLMQA